MISYCDPYTLGLVGAFLERIATISPQGMEKFREALNVGRNALPDNEDDSTYEASYLFDNLFELTAPEPED